MSEPGLLQSGEAGQSLWERAPVWRNLTIAATLFSLAAISLPLLPQPATTTSAEALSITVNRLAPAHALATNLGAQAPTQHPSDKEAPAAKTAQQVSQAQQSIRKSTTPEPQSAPHLTGKSVRMPSLSAQTKPQPLPEPSALATSTSAPVALPQTASSTSCNITLTSDVHPMGAGVVVGFENVIEAQQRMVNNERGMGGPINPAYANTPRAMVRMDGNSGGNQIVVLPPGMVAKIGDHIAFNSIHRDTAVPCGYVPPLATVNDGPSHPLADTVLAH
jgi:hypothetical protein